MLPGPAQADLDGAVRAVCGGEGVQADDQVRGKHPQGELCGHHCQG